MKYIGIIHPRIYIYIHCIIYIYSGIIIHPLPLKLMYVNICSYAKDGQKTPFSPSPDPVGPKKPPRRRRFTGPEAHLVGIVHDGLPQPITPPMCRCVAVPRHKTDVSGVPPVSPCVSCEVSPWPSKGQAIRSQETCPCRVEPLPP